MNQKILWGVFMIVAGILVLIRTKRYPAKKPDIWLADEKGYFGGVGLIFLGLWMIWDIIKNYLPLH